MKPDLGSSNYTGNIEKTLLRKTTVTAKGGQKCPPRQETRKYEKPEDYAYGIFRFIFAFSLIFEFYLPAFPHRYFQAVPQNFYGMRHEIPHGVAAVPLFPPLSGLPFSLFVQAHSTSLLSHSNFFLLTSN